MYDELEALRERINRLSNEELTQMVSFDYEQYRKEALDYAQAEMQRRGLKKSEEEPEESRAPRVEFKMYRGELASWDELFSEAAAFATEVGLRRLINISHSEDANEGVVTVWYWA